MASAMLQKQLQEEFRVDDARQVAERLADLPDQKRLLWVDDHPQNNVSEIASLRKMQIEVDAVTSTSEALDRLKPTEAFYDLVISDWERFRGSSHGSPRGYACCIKCGRREVPCRCSSTTEPLTQKRFRRGANRCSGKKGRERHIVLMSFLSRWPDSLRSRARMQSAEGPAGTVCWMAYTQCRMAGYASL